MLCMPSVVSADITNRAHDFVFVVKTDNPGASLSNQFIIPVYPSGAVPYLYDIDCNNTNPTVFNSTYSNVTHPNASALERICIYSEPGTYTIRIRGTFPRIFFTDKSDDSRNTRYADKKKIVNIKQWGSVGWTNMSGAFRGCSNLTSSATDEPVWADGAVNISFANAFQDATSFNADLNNWDMSKVVNLNSVFSGATSFNNGQSLDNSSNALTWDTQSVSSMRMAFRNSNFNQSLDSWNVSNVSDMSSMFSYATKFNQNLSSWRVDNLTNVLQMFNGAIAFNNGEVGNTGSRPLTWGDKTKKINAIAGMFNGATSFNQDISSWTITNITQNSGTSDVFKNAKVFNNGKPAGVNSGALTWDTSQVKTVAGMFDGAEAFNQSLGLLNVEKVTFGGGNNLLLQSNLSRRNYDQTLAGFAGQNILSIGTVNNRPLKYCLSEVHRSTLISKGWNIVGDSKNCAP